MPQRYLRSRCCGSGPCIDQLHAYRIDAQVETFKGSGAQQHKVARLAEHDFVESRLASSVN
jgi:hypothetical protein